MTIPSVLAFLVIAAVPVHWYLALRLWQLRRAAPGVSSIRERWAVAVALALIVTVFAGVFLNNGMAVPVLDSFTTMVITRAAILAMVGPALYWLVLFRRAS